jgi:acyl carrier protein
MIPSGFVRLESIPLTPNGKIDRMALSEAEAIRLELDTPYVRPQSEIERKLAQIWEEVLGVRAIGKHDNFFDLGGHSLLATQVSAKLTSEFRVELPLRTLFDKPTVEDQAIAIARMQAESAGQDPVERILTELAALSDEEAQRLLTKDDTGGKRRE